MSITKITIDDVSITAEKWIISITETHDDAELHPPVRMVLPTDVMMWRAAEYNLPTTDMDTLVDIMVCEQYVHMDHYQSEVGLFNAPDIKTAREEYLKAIAAVKLKYRISTRGAKHPLNAVRTDAKYNPGAMAMMGMDVLMIRHNSGVEELPESVHTIFNRVREASEVNDGGVR